LRQRCGRKILKVRVMAESGGVYPLRNAGIRGRIHVEAGEIQKEARMVNMPAEEGNAAFKPMCIKAPLNVDTTD
jgi:hypothetical protein